MRAQCVRAELVHPFGPGVLFDGTAMIMRGQRGEGAAVDSVHGLVSEYVEQNKSVPGASLAIGRGRQIISARGFGCADLETREEVRPDSLFRIASVSKTFTSAAIMLLVQRGLIDLSTAAFPLLDLDLTQHARSRPDPRLNTITIHHLLCHTGGWARETATNPYESWTGFDPMFFPVEIADTLGVRSPAQPADIVRFMATMPLDFDPGTRYAYSNFGYCVLGRVIEKAASMPYEAFVQREILEPLGINHARLGRSLLSNRAPREVHYYSGNGQPDSKNVFGGPDVPWCYGGFELEAMDSHGGWITTPSELLRFGASLDPSANHGNLAPESIGRLFRRPAETGYAANVELPSYYGYGWNVHATSADGIQAWHDGVFGGTSALLMRRPDGLVWALVSNTESDDTGQSPTQALAPDINRLLDLSAD